MQPEKQRWQQSGETWWQTCAFRCSSPVETFSV